MKLLSFAVILPLSSSESSTLHVLPPDTHAHRAGTDIIEKYQDRIPDASEWSVQAFGFGHRNVRIMMPHSSVPNL